MKTVRYGLIACFCLGAAWGVAHLATLPNADALATPGLSIVPAAHDRSQERWRYLPILR
ncbi:MULTISPECIES: hypothetical protein [Sphingobium]|uniref:Uncharacterized protein n=1 Tax=Sphingobium cupriresistens LL01 TaxID=1420583 RepID=A0A0J7Y4C3_9SPHN|nr:MULTISPECIES: hypothetical protein [Sphingobium]KMS58704.1 hypothetical protein V473_02755 [Sphingobium cupriresistens LL01]MBJ7378436.1 hypothetical protein [Sphingobium sp.]WCP14164.1 hypothetical protein sphantq_02608 [Sphingobium sp. AntQ-1]